MSRPAAPGSPASPREGAGRGPRYGSIDLEIECDEAWEAMRPTPGGRHCARCDRHVVDLSSLRRETALGIVARGEACVSFLATERGEPIFRPDPPRLSGALIVLGTSLFAACSSPDGPPPPFTPIATEPTLSPAEPLVLAPPPVQLAAPTEAHGCGPPPPDPLRPIGVAPPRRRHAGRPRSPR